jgi:hypothetical protein
VSGKGLTQGKNVDWIKDNIGKVISAVALICTILGFIGGIWATHESMKTDIETIKNDLWWVKQALSHSE